MKKSLTVPLLAATTATGTVATSLLAADIEVIFSKIAGHPTSVVPGAVDANGDPAFSEFRAMHDLIGSPDGSRWLLRARTQLGSGLENILLLGEGTQATNFAQAGQPIHDGLPGEIYDFFGSGLGRFNDNNDFAFSARATGGVSAHAQKVIRVINGVPNMVMQQGDLYVGLIDVPGNPSGDETVGNSVGSVHLLNDGTVGVHDGGIQNIHTSRRPALFYNNIAFHQTNVTDIVGMDGFTLFKWDTINSNTFYTTPSTTPISLGEDEERWLAIGRRSGQPLPDRCFVVDGHIVLETNQPLPGAPNIVSSIVSAEVVSNGDWYARGASDGGTRTWTMRNGAVFARSSDPVPGTEERWAASFSLFTGNSLGDWVLIGRTDNPDVTRDEVIVVNGAVVVREGDPIDLSGNGKFDDDVFIGRSNPNNASFPGQAFISHDGYLYFLANLVDGNGNEYQTIPVFTTPTALLRLNIRPSEPCFGDITGDGSVDVSDLLALFSAWGSCPRGDDCPADLTGDGFVDVSDLLALFGAWGPCD